MFDILLYVAFVIVSYNLSVELERDIFND